MRRGLAIVAGLVAVSLALGGIALATHGGLHRDITRRFLDVRGTVEFLDVDPQQPPNTFDPSPGDTFFFSNTLRDLANTKDVGRFLSKCVAIVGVEFKCSGTLLLRRGTIELSALVDFASSDPIVAAVVGGTGLFRNVGGQATITPTATEGTSRLVVELLALE